MRYKITWALSMVLIGLASPSRGATVDPFAPLRTVGADWRYEAVTRKGDKLTVAAGPPLHVKVLGVRDIVLCDGDDQSSGESYIQDHPAGRYTVVVLGTLVGDQPVRKFVEDRTNKRHPSFSVLERFGDTTTIVIAPDRLRQCGPRRYPSVKP